MNIMHVHFSGEGFILVPSFEIIIGSLHNSREFICLHLTMKKVSFLEGTGMYSLILMERIKMLDKPYNIIVHEMKCYYMHG
jgi:hypothetical protein